MSIYIKEYLSILIIIGTVKVFFGNKKLDGALKLISFFAMMSMIVMPVANLVIQGDFIKLSKSFKTENIIQSGEYTDYFAKAVADSAIEENILQAENAFKAEFVLRGIEVYECKASYNGTFNIDISADGIIGEDKVNRLKDKYGVDKVRIRLVNSNERNSA